MTEPLDLDLQGPVTPPKNLSPSAIGQWEQCPWRFRENRIYKNWEPPTAAMAKGTLVHLILEELFKLPPEERTLENARGLATEAFQHWSIQRDLKRAKVFGKDRNSFKWEAWYLVEAYFRLEDPTSFTPEGLEQKMESFIEGVLVKGVIDRWSATEGGRIITDYKTGKAPKPRYEADKRLQLMLYVLMMEDDGSPPIEEVEFLYLGSEDRVTYEPTDEDRREAAETVKRVWGEIEAACATNDFPTRTGPLCNWCHFKGNGCPAWD